MLNDNKTIVARWFKEFWGNPWNPDIIHELAAAGRLTVQRTLSGRPIAPPPE
jgi:hypothetical protein